MPLVFASHQLRLITFDVDGTLYDSGRHRAKLLPLLIRAPRVVLAFRDVVAELRGQEHADLPAVIAAKVAERTRISAESARQILDRTVYGVWPDSFTPGMVLAGLDEVFAMLDAEGVPRAVLSDHPAERKLERMGLRGWAAVQDCEAVGAFKPHPRGLLALAERFSLSPQQILHVGDREDTDAAMAEAAGAICLIRGRDFEGGDQLGRLLFGRRWTERKHG